MPQALVTFNVSPALLRHGLHPFMSPPWIWMRNGSPPQDHLLGCEAPWRRPSRDFNWRWGRGGTSIQVLLLVICSSSVLFLTTCRGFLGHTSRNPQRSPGSRPQLGLMARARTLGEFKTRRQSQGSEENFKALNFGEEPRAQWTGQRIEEGTAWFEHESRTVFLGTASNISVFRLKKQIDTTEEEMAVRQQKYLQMTRISMIKGAKESQPQSQYILHSPTVDLGHRQSNSWSNKYSFTSSGLFNLFFHWIEAKLLYLPQPRQFRPG